MKLVSKQTWFIVWDLLLDHLQFSKNKKIKNKKGEYNTHGHYSVFFGYLLAWFFFGCVRRQSLTSHFMVLCGLRDFQSSYSYR